VICSAVTFTILLVSANSIAMSVRERTREMGILRTLGYTPGEIRGMVLGESVVIALLGGCSAWASRPASPAPAAPARAVGRGVQVPLGSRRRRDRPLAVVIGVVSAFVPRSACVRRNNVVESLRFTG
jgi:putative ABC transport system permease protein